VRFVIATGNRHKLGEFRGIFAGHEVEAMPSDVGLPPEGEESFAVNALVKAEALAQALRVSSAAPLCLADDSGLEVEALDWAPGVTSSRYCGHEGDDAANVAKLLAALRGVAPALRRARFVCCIACVLPDGRRFESRGEWWGAIAAAPRGRGGFGYDPVFVPEGSDLSVAEWPQAQKDAASHRARAARAVLATLTAEGVL